MEPPVSVPSEAIHSSAATEAADPPLEPPHIYSVFQGFLGGPKAQFSDVEPMANSSIETLPKSTAPAFFNLAIEVAS
jgi:hypothetical protein